jgi:light-harvesting complex I chlorophyll a/b binding protein 1
MTTRASRTRRSATKAGSPASGKAGASSAKKVTLSASSPTSRAATTPATGGTSVAVKTAPKEPKAASVKDVEKVERAFAKPSAKFARGLLGGQGAFANADYNFDPLGISEKLPDALPFFRESELKHGRVAMLAFVGMVAPDIGFTIPALPERCASAGMGEDKFFPKTIQAHDMCVGDENGPGPLVFVLIAAGLIEVVTTAQKVLLGWGLTLENAGDYPGRKEIGDFLGQTPKREDQMTVLRLNELKHGRLAMLAFSAAITQAPLSGNGFPWWNN